jgi:diphosphomevalonate decarboxylase
MENHVYAEGRFKQAGKNLIRLLNAMNSGDLPEFISIMENEALSLHSLMMSSDPGYILLQPNSVRIIESVRNYRRDTGYPVGFTLDAGANVHLLYPLSIEAEIKTYIKDQLLQYCENGLVIHDQVGNGPVQKTYS